jgi:hypothetical protein
MMSQPRSQFILAIHFTITTRREYLLNLACIIEMKLEGSARFVIRQCRLPFGFVDWRPLYALTGKQRRRKPNCLCEVTLQRPLIKFCLDRENSPAELCT